MKASELRIGNWVELEFNPELPNTERVMQVSRIDYDFILPPPDGEYYINGYEACKFSPIPLTPEILEKCGFTQDASRKILSVSGTVFKMGESLEAENSVRLYYNDRCVNKPIQYLHQLQNLYFALAGTELNPQIT